MKKCMLLVILALAATPPGFSQTINSDYFPKNNRIDNSYSSDMQKWTTNGEWESVVGKYASVWKNQLLLEKTRLVRLNPQQKAQIEKSESIWNSAIDESIRLVANNVDGNRVGREPYISWLMEITDKYRERAIYYFCLYYTILETNDPNFDYKADKKLAE